MKPASTVTISALITIFFATAAFAEGPYEFTVDHPPLLKDHSIEYITNNAPFTKVTPYTVTLDMSELVNGDSDWGWPEHSSTGDYWTHGTYEDYITAWGAWDGCAQNNSLQGQVTRTQSWKLLYTTTTAASQDYVKTETFGSSVRDLQSLRVAASATIGGAFKAVSASVTAEVESAGEQETTWSQETTEQKTVHLVANTQYMFWELTDEFVITTNSFFYYPIWWALGIPDTCSYDPDSYHSIGYPMQQASWPPKTVSATVLTYGDSRPLTQMSKQ